MGKLKIELKSFQTILFPQAMLGFKQDHQRRMKVLKLSESPRIYSGSFALKYSYSYCTYIGNMKNICIIILYISREHEEYLIIILYISREHLEYFYDHHEHIETT